MELKMPTVLITGANRGLGLEFCHQYAAENWTVIACCRQPNLASELNKLCHNYPIQLEKLDVADFNQVDALAHKLADARINFIRSLISSSTHSGKNHRWE